MLQSQLFYQTLKENPKDEEAINARLLIRAGFIDKVMAGVYSYLPLGWRVLKKIENIIREEMDALGGQEILMPALHPEENWQKTGRWKDLAVLFKLTSTSGKNLALGPTHEEIVTPLAQKIILSYQDLPAAVYQIQTKFRDEPRSKSGLLRAREFIMKDLYSFHTTEKDLDNFYQQAEKAYEKIWERLSIGKITVKTYASGGTFSKYSHEYQTLSETGEDTVFLCENCKVAINKELIHDQKNCPECGNKKLVEKNAIEVGNIFKLKTKFSEAFDFNYIDKKDKKKPVVMGCYGLGPSRVMGTLVEIFHDEKGIIWPMTVAPFQVHLINLSPDDKKSKRVYENLLDKNFEVLYDERDVSAGIKLTEADLIGIPHRLVISEKTKGKLEYKFRSARETRLIDEEQVIGVLTDKS